MFRKYFIGSEPCEFEIQLFGRCFETEEFIEQLNLKFIEKSSTQIP